MVGPQQACANGHVRRVTIVCGSQMGKTDSLMNIIGARLDDDPAPILYVGPTRNNVEKIIEPRLMAMFRSAVTLWARVAKGKLSSKTAKRVSGVLCRLAWAGSATELASQEAAVGIMDEVDRMAFDVKGEGSPIELVEARLATFPGSKLILTSTPTEGNVNEQLLGTGLSHWAVSDPKDVKSAIWRLWQEGTRFEWSWPCPDCREYFIPRFNLVKWPKGASPATARREARLACPHCGSLIEDKQKAAMNASGRYVAPGQSVTVDGDVTGELEPNDHWSFWVSGLASPWKTWGQRAADFITVSKSGDPGRVQGVLNTGFGELYRVGGDAPDWQEVRKRAGTYSSGEIPADGLWLTVGVDVQKDRLIYEVRAWGYGMESWLIEFDELWGDTSNIDVWTRLRNDVIGRDYGGGLKIRKAVIDSGYKPGEESSEHIVYRFCRDSGGIAVPSKGHDTQSKPLHAAQIDVRVDGRVIKKGLQLWHLDSDFFKSFVHGRLRQPIDQPGGWNLPQDVTEEYCQQLVAEARAMKASGRAIWVRVRKDNHALDCAAMNVAAAHMLGAHMMRRPEKRVDVPPPPPSGSTPAPMRRPQRGAWSATNWRR